MKRLFPLFFLEKKTARTGPLWMWSNRYSLIYLKPFRVSHVSIRNKKEQMNQLKFANHFPAPDNSIELGWHRA